MPRASQSPLRCRARYRLTDPEHAAQVGQGDRGRQPEDLSARHRPRLGPYRTEKECKEAVVEALGDVKAGTYADDRQTTLRVYLLRWSEGQQLARKQRTYESYAGACHLYWIPALGHVRLTALREQHVRDAHKAMRKLNRPAEMGTSPRCSVGSPPPAP
jgi:hypothetical protein